MLINLKRTIQVPDTLGEGYINVFLPQVGVTLSDMNKFTGGTET